MELPLQPAQSSLFPADIARHRRRHRDRNGPDSRGTWDIASDLVLETASGRSTVSEDLDLGRDEFVPGQLGAVT